MYQLNWNHPFKRLKPSPSFYKWHPKIKILLVDFLLFFFFLEKGVWRRGGFGEEVLAWKIDLDELQALQTDFFTRKPGWSASPDCYSEPPCPAEKTAIPRMAGAGCFLACPSLDFCQPRVSPKQENSSSAYLCFGDTDSCLPVWGRNHKTRCPWQYNLDWKQGQKVNSQCFILSAKPLIRVFFDVENDSWLFRTYIQNCNT